MCGIAGILRREQQDADREIVRGMLAPLALRGPDFEGVDREGPITLGHRRLAIIDLSAAGRQPMRSADGRYLISYNGEVYNFHDLRDELGLKPQDLRSTSDTEVLLHAWARWGPAALGRMVGQWAFALYDRSERRLWLARDRFGEKPLFYHEHGGVLAFASSIQALIQAPWVPREIDQDALAEYVTLRYVVAPRTILAGIRKLSPGHLMTAGPEGVVVRRWYDPRFSHAAEAGGPRRREDLVEEFGALLVQASRRCLVSDVPVALLLSDGIDSNSIRVALGSAGCEVSAITYRRGGWLPNATPIGDSGRGGVETLDLPFTPEERFRQLVPAFAGFTEPVGDGAALAIWLLIHNARSRATVFLSGNGGDEILGGYRLDQDLLRLAGLRRLAWLPGPLLEKVLARHTYGAEPAAVRRLALRNAPGPLLPAAARYLIHRPLPAEDLSRLFQPGPAPGNYLGVVDRLYAECPDDAGDLDRVQEVMLRTFLPENILSFSDSVAMGSSAELRLPFLDRDLVEFVLRLPPRMRVGLWCGRARTKQILRWWWQKEHPSPNGVARKKRTFNYGSIRHLLAGRGDELRSLILEAPAVRRALPGVESWLREPASFFRGPFEGTLWALLTLAVWCDSVGVP